MFKSREIVPLLKHILIFLPGRIPYQSNIIMDHSRHCQKCKQRTLVPDDESGKIMCSSCGTVQEFDNFQAHIGGVTGAAGTYVRVGSAGTGNVLSYKQKKEYEAQKLIEDLTYKLDISGKFQEVKRLVEEITEGEYGTGEWFPIFVSACAYVEMRKEGKTMLPIVQVADVVNCDVHELGRMISRVVDYMDLELSEFDIVNAFERAIRNSPSFRKVSEDMLKTMLQQGVFLIQCLIKWCLTTGRRPIPVVVAVMAFVAELNDFSVKIEDLAKELHVAVITCRKRHKELKETLVKVASRVLPWGEDVTVKNIMNNAPFVIQYMEMKSMQKNGGKKKGSVLELVNCDIDELVDDCLRKRSFSDFLAEDCESQYFNVGRSSNLIEGCSDKFQISLESLAMLYSNYMDEISFVKASGNFGNNKRKMGKIVDFEEYRDWWRGKSDLCKKLMPDQIPEKDVGWDDAPPSFNKGLEVKEERRERIKASKLRIQKIMQPVNEESGLGNEICVFDSEKSKEKKKMKRRKMEVEIDSEDLIIGTLLLHGVKEEEILKGYYKALLDLHVFNDPGV